MSEHRRWCPARYATAAPCVCGEQAAEIERLRAACAGIDDILRDVARVAHETMGDLLAKLAAVRKIVDAHDSCVDGPTAAEALDEIREALRLHG